MNNIQLKHTHILNYLSSVFTLILFFKYD